MTAEQKVEFLERVYNTAYYGLPKSDPGHQSMTLCNSPFRLYIEALYWSLGLLTSGTPIGPEKESEIHVVNLAVVVGLAFFALLLSQVPAPGNINA